MIFRTLVCTIVAGMLALAGCGPKAGGAASKKLVLYSAGDSIFTKQVIDEFKKETGIEVEVATDTETTRGVKHRMAIETEKDKPRADVFWNNELVNTIVLAKKGLLFPYKSPSGEKIPDAYRDEQGMWAAFGARARVFIVNTDLVKPEEMPKSMNDMLDPKWKKRVGIARPVGGTTATHAAALFVLMGDEKAKEFYAGLKKNEVVICNGNGHVKDQVAAGELAWGWTDTNDANIAIRDKKPVKIVYPDQDGEGIGTLLIPHSVCIVKGGPNQDNAKKFVDFLLKPETEKMLAAGPSAQIPVRPGIEVPEEALKHFIMDLGKIRSFNSKIDWGKVADKLDEVIKYMNEQF